MISFPFPIVDLSGGRRALALEVDRVCRETGFLGISGHGFSAELLRDTWDSARAFFDLPPEKKMRVAMPFPGYPYGYAPYEGERLAQSLGEATPPDLKETFSIGPPVTWDATGWSRNDGFNTAPTQWPEEPEGLRGLWCRYFEEMGALSARIMALFAVALELEEDFFASSIDRHASALRALNYPATRKTPLPGQHRAGAHSDYGSLTILAGEPGSKGLEIRHPEGFWQPVPIEDGTFIVNIGDLMARWSNDRWVSTVHRVTCDGADRRRQSLAFFHLPNWDAEIACLPTCLAPGEAPKYPPVEAGAHLMEKFRSTVRG